MCRKNFENRLTNKTLMTKNDFDWGFCHGENGNKELTLSRKKNVIYNIVFKIPRHTYLGYKHTRMNKIIIWKVGQGVPQ